MGGAVAFNELGLGPTVQSLFHRLMWATAGRTVDARALIADALAGGPSLFRWTAARALADTDGVEPLSVVHIKVVNHVATPLLFRLGAPDSEFKTTVLGSDRDAGQAGSEALRPLIFSNFTFAEGAERLAAAGMGSLSAQGLGLAGEESTATYGSKFRMNGWFARWLHDPASADAGTATDLSGKYSTSGLVSGTANGPFNHNVVGLQCALGLDQTRGGNHSLKNLKLRLDKPDLGFYVQDKGIIRSPLGVSVFMMGGKYDKAEGDQDHNVLIRSSADEEVSAADGVSVKQHADSIIQSIQAQDSGYVDTRGDDSLTQTFDKLVSAEPSLRRAMEAARDQFKQEIASLADTAALETRSAFATTDDARLDGSLQSAGGASPAANGSDLSTRAQPAKGEFLAQIRYTSQLLRMPGRPVRNFSLFLNMQDVDGNPIDVPASGVPFDGIQCLTYIEGMRQLAIGLNALARVIEEKGNVVVVVTAEGGRGNGMGDAIVSFGLVMGPKSKGFSTALYSNLDQISDPTSVQATNPGSANGVHMYNTSHPHLRDAGGAAVSARPNVGDLQVGVVRALAEMEGSGMSLAELGNFVRVRS